MRFNKLPRGISTFCILLIIISFRLSAQESELEKLLSLDLEELANLKVVSVTKSPIYIRDAPATVRVITAAAIKQNGFLTLDDALAQLPGFQFRNIQGFNSYIFQRGIPNQNNLTLVLVDGIQINELNSGGFYGGGQYNLADVERIEVVYGPASALYGTNAVSGIINIITKSPDKYPGFSGSGYYGTFNNFSGDLSYSQYNHLDEYGFRISAMAKSSEKADLRGMEGDNNWSDEMENFEDDYSINFKGIYKSLSLGFLYQNKQSSRTTNYKSAGTLYSDRNTLWNISFINAYLRTTHSFSELFKLSSTLYFRDATIHDNTIAFIDTVQTGYYRPNHLFGFENIVEFNPAGNIDLLGGILYEDESLAENYSVTSSTSATERPSTPPPPQMLRNSLLSIFLQANFRITELLKLSAGSRLDFSSVYDQVLTPRAALIYSRDNLQMKVLYSQAFRAPKPWDYNYGNGNPDLQPEKMKSLEFSAAYEFTHGWNTDVAVYKNTLSEIFILESASDHWINMGDINIFGMEIGFEHFSEHIKTDVNYTYTNSEDADGKKVPEIAEHCANAGIIYHPIADLGISFRFSYLGSRENYKIITATGSSEIEPAFIINTFIRYELSDDIFASIGINNLLDEKYFHPSNRPPERYRQPQRTFILKAGYELF